MDSTRRTALAVGVLFILTFITSIGAVFAYGSILSDPNYITSAGADGRVFLGAFLELGLILTNIGCATVLFPLLKKQNEGLALAYVAARLVECTFILIGILSVFLLGPGLTDGVGTGLILGYLMYRSGLVSRRMALFGVVGGPLLAASGIAVLMGVIPQGSSVQGIATAPEFIWEAFLGLWLTFKGFSRSPIASSYAAPAGGDLAFRAPTAAGI